MTNDTIDELLHFQEGAAYILWGDVSSDPDLIDYNELAEAEAASVYEEAFGEGVEDWRRREAKSLADQGRFSEASFAESAADEVEESLWLDIQRMWQFPSPATRIEVPAVLDEDGDIDYDCYDAINEAVCAFARDNARLTDEARENLVARLMATYPERICQD